MGEDLVAHKVRARLNDKQADWMKDTCNACRLAYNYAISKLREPFVGFEGCLEAADQPAKYSSRIDGALQPAVPDFRKVKFPTAFSISKEWTQDRDRMKHTRWIKPRGVNLDTVSSVFNNNYGAALNQWKLANWAPDKKPTFHGKRHKLSSIWRGRTIKQIDSRTFQLPNGMGTFKIGIPLRFIGEIRSVTFSEEGGKWYASFLIKTDLPRPAPAPAGTAVGIDVGVKQFASLSDGQQFPPAPDYEREYAKKKRLQKNLSRKQGPIKNQRKPSNRWKKAKSKLRRQEQHIANKRRHYIECVSKTIAEQNETVVVEALKLKNMTASAKGTADDPGSKVAQKSGLNRSILNGGFGMFRTRLKAKVDARSGRFITVDPSYTSQTCPACGHIAKENRPTQAEFCCVKCGHRDNADINAAKNILVRGLQAA